MKIYNWNVNGIRSIIRKKSINLFIEEYKPDILCLTETRIDHDNLVKNNFFKSIFQDYFGYWNVPIYKKGYSGTAILTKIKPITHGFYDNEGRITVLVFNNFVLINVYVPNAGDKLKRLDYRINEWSIFFQQVIQKYLNSEKLLIICGDFNVCHKELDTFHMNERFPGMTIEEREEFEFLLNKFQLEDSFRIKYPNTV